MKRSARIILSLTTVSAGMGVLTHVAFGNTASTRVNISNNGDNSHSEVRVHNSVQGTTIINGQTVQQGSNETTVKVNGEEVCSGNSGDCNYEKDGVKVNISNQNGSTKVTQESNTSVTNDINVNNNTGEVNGQKDRKEKKTRAERKAERRAERKAARQKAKQQTVNTKKGHLIYVDESLFEMFQRFFKSNQEKNS
jgi:hypothetical protein